MKNPRCQPPFGVLWLAPETWPPRPDLSAGVPSNTVAGTLIV